MITRTEHPSPLLAVALRLLALATTLLVVVVAGHASPAGASALPVVPGPGLAVSAGPATPALELVESASPAGVDPTARGYDHPTLLARGDGSGAFSGSFSGCVATRGTRALPAGPQPRAAIGSGTPGPLPMRQWDDAPFDGFLANWRTTETLQPGTRIDRFGPETGRFLSPEGTPLPNRALPPGTAGGNPSAYEVVKPVDVQAGLAAPAFGQPGLGIQYMTNSPVADLIEAGILKPVG